MQFTKLYATKTGYKLTWKSLCLQAPLPFQIVTFGSLGKRLMFIHLRDNRNVVENLKTIANDSNWCKYPWMSLSAALNGTIKSTAKIQHKSNIFVKVTSFLASPYLYSKQTIQWTGPLIYYNWTHIRLQETTVSKLRFPITAQLWYGPPRKLLATRR